MDVLVDLRIGDGAVSLRDVDDLRSFQVRVLDDGTGVAGLERALDGIGSIAVDGSAFLRCDAVRALAGDRSEEWVAGFDDMIEFARERGWVGPDGSTLQAHCVWTSE